MCVQRKVGSSKAAPAAAAANHENVQVIDLD
jgi:hypothetical protein